MFNKWINLFFPNPCLTCDQQLGSNEQFICTACKLDLPFSNEHLSPKESSANKLFWGKVEVEQVYSGFIFKKGNIIQELLHQLKYNNQPLLGVEMGKWLAEEMLKYNIPLPDVIVPVPLHKKRARVRGYNQSLQLAKGISEITKLPINDQLVKREVYNVSQTKQSRFSRWDNVSTLFKVGKKLPLQHQHILIVDDVITTGSTVEAICSALKNEFPECKISVAVFAVTKV